MMKSTTGRIYDCNRSTRLDQVSASPRSAGAHCWASLWPLTKERATDDGRENKTGDAVVETESKPPSLCCGEVHHMPVFELSRNGASRRWIWSRGITPIRADELNADNQACNRG